MENMEISGSHSVPLSNGLRVQIIPTVTDLPRSQIHHFAAFVQDTRSLVVWDDEPEKILERVAELQNRVMEVIWKQEKAGEGHGSSVPDEGIQGDKEGDGGDPAGACVVEVATALRVAAREHGATMVLRRRPAGLVVDGDVALGPPPSTAALLRRVKDALDPDGRFAPERFGDWYGRACRDQPSEVLP